MSNVITINRPSWRVCLKNEPEITGTIVSEHSIIPNEVVVLWDDSDIKWTIGRDRLVFLSDDQDTLKRQLLGSALIGTLERLRDQISDAIADVERVMGGQS